MSSKAPNIPCRSDTRIVHVSDKAGRKPQKNRDVSSASEGLRSIEDGEIVDTSGSNVSQDTTAFASENDVTVLSTADETVIEKRSWKKFHRHDDSLEDGEVRSQDGSGVNPEMYSSYMCTTIMDRSDSTAVAAEADLTNKDIPVTELQISKKRKRSLTDIGNELTPKHLKLEQLLTNDENVSPIEPIARSADCVITCSKNMQDTPMIACKFDFSVSANKVMNSTPIAHSHLRKNRKVIRKSMFGKTKQDENVRKNVDRQLEELKGDVTQADSENVSKIDISMFANEKTSSNANSMEKQTVSDTSSEKDGRFKNIEANLSTVTVVDTDMDDLTEDILGLEENYSDDIIETGNLESDNDKTLVPENSVIYVGSETAPKTPEQESNKDKDGHDKDKLTKTAIPFPDQAKKPVVSEQAISLTTKVDKAKSVSVQAKSVKPNIEVTKHAEIKSNKKQATMKEENVVITDEDIHDISLLDTSWCRLQDVNELMTDARRRWESHGIPSPDVNLTTATTFRQSYKDKGLEIVPGTLEGEKLCCLNLYEGEVDSNNNNAKGKPCLQRVDQTVMRLRQQLEMLEEMRRLEQGRVRERFSWLQEQANYRLTTELRRLHQMQGRECEQTLRGFRGSCQARQRQLMRLNMEHLAQRNRLELMHQQEYSCQEAEMKVLLQTEDARHEERRAPILRLLQELKMPQQSRRDTAKFGPMVTVALTKAPCRDNNRQFTFVNTCLPAAVAQATLQEDGIMDYFYSY